MVLLEAPWGKFSFLVSFLWQTGNLLKDFELIGFIGTNS